jgi:hypothetical protein
VGSDKLVIECRLRRDISNDSNSLPSQPDTKAMGNLEVSTVRQNMLGPKPHKSEEKLTNISSLSQKEQGPESGTPGTLSHSLLKTSNLRRKGATAIKRGLASRNRTSAYFHARNFGLGSRLSLRLPFIGEVASMVRLESRSQCVIQLGLIFQPPGRPTMFIDSMDYWHERPRH